MIDKAELEARMVEAANDAFYQHIQRPLEAAGGLDRMPDTTGPAFRAGFAAGVTWMARLPELVAAIDELDPEGRDGV